MSIDQEWLKTARGVFQWLSPFHAGAVECPEGANVIIFVMNGLGYFEECPNEFFNLCIHLVADGVYGEKAKAAWAMLGELCGDVTVTEQPISVGSESDSDVTIIEGDE